MIAYFISYFVIYRRIEMSLSLGVKSIFLFVLSAIFLLLLTLLESSLSGLSLTAERILSFLLLVIPAVIGVLLGVMSLRRKESKPWLAIFGIMLNGLFALFHIFVISFAG